MTTKPHAEMLQGDTILLTKLLEAAALAAAALAPGCEHTIGQPLLGLLQPARPVAAPLREAALKTLHAALLAAARPPPVSDPLAFRITLLVCRSVWLVRR